jgi:mono/diheme cytochrome c family protein
MMSPRVLIAASAAMLSVAISGTALNGRTTPETAAVGLTPSLSQKPTTNDGVYTKKQADAAKAQFDKICADCHPFTVAGKKKLKDLPLGEDPFYENWTGRPLADMISTIALTMPNDGSAVVSDEEAADLVAYILQQNGFKPGDTPLTKATAGAIVERPKK